MLEDTLDLDVKSGHTAIVQINYLVEVKLFFRGSLATDNFKGVGQACHHELRLTLSSEKTLITHFSKQYITFLGTLIKGTWEREKKLATVKRKGVTRKEKVTSRTVLKAPIKLLFKKATLNGFFKKRNNEFVPTYVGRCINWDHEDILRLELS